MFEKFQAWENEKSKNAMFKSMMNYLHQVETILHFVAASRNADIHLHLEAGEKLSRLFFAMDRLKYKRLWPRYILDMHALKTKHPNTWLELESGNISITKSDDIPFVSIGADHALEQVNKTIKDPSSLIGISNNANARQRFFLAMPEIGCLSDEYQNQFGHRTNVAREHHNLMPSIIKREHTIIDKIKAAITSHTNPFTVEGDSLYNIISHAYVPQEYVQQILDIDQIGQKLYENYVADCIVGNTSLWAPVKRENNKMYTSGSKRQSMQIRDKAIDLRETKDLYGRLMILCKSSRDVDMKKVIGEYEFTLTPRSLFAPNGSMLMCTDKSKLIHELQKLVLDNSSHDSSDNNLQPMSTQGLDRSLVEDDVVPEPSHKVAIIDGMVIVQKLAKSSMQTVSDLCRCFIDKVMYDTRDFDEIVVVLDTYKDDSLKNTTREKRQQGRAPVQYEVSDDTKLRHIPMKQFLSHNQTKADLTIYLANKIISYSEHLSKLIIVSAGGQTRSNGHIIFDENNHDEADTLMINQALLVAQRSPPDCQLTVFSPDTDVLVLLIANYNLLPSNTSISMLSAIIEIKPLWVQLGEDKAKALPALHAFSGCDNTGRFSGLGKIKWFKLFLSSDTDTINTFQKLLDNDTISEGMISTLASFVCKAYLPKGIKITDIPELRWHLFCKKMAESEKLPPTLGSLVQHIHRVHVQSRTWGQASHAMQVTLDPIGHGYYKTTNGQIVPKTTNDPPAPEALVEMVRCQCKTNCTSQRCSCQRKNLPCTDMCLCSTDCENDEDTHLENSALSDNDSDVDV